MDILAAEDKRQHKGYLLPLILNYLGGSFLLDVRLSDDIKSFRLICYSQQSLQAYIPQYAKKNHF